VSKGYDCSLLAHIDTSLSYEIYETKSYVSMGSRASVYLFPPLKSIGSLLFCLCPLTFRARKRSAGTACRSCRGVKFDPAGIIPSGGECQKLMFAHCFYGRKPILVMDESSSALDPVMERMLKTVKDYKLSKNRELYCFLFSKVVICNQDKIE
jgi:ABC-type bacteriocin/lantibiotic exporters, contain an N-terminal double-glycine peptidase domain